MNYNFTKTVNSEKLHDELKASSINSKYTCLNVTPPNLTIITSSNLTTEENDALNTIINNHSPSYPQQYVGGIISNASAYGLQLIKDFGTRNVLAGKTEADIDSILENLDTLKICVALVSGSLKYARRKTHTIEPFVGITQSDKDWLIAQLTLFLGPE